MSRTRLSIAGASTLLGQNLLVRLHQHPDFTVESLHDLQAGPGGAKLSDLCDWHGPPEILRHYDDVPLHPADAPAPAPLLLSFLPDSQGETVEARHLARGTRVLSHCEYARLTAPLILPGLTRVTGTPPLMATPNCTTAICGPVIQALHARFGVTRATITTLQAISGTDLPGMPASAIHDRVVGHLGGEADALAKELAILFDGAFAVDAFATRVPVWRGHVITLALDLAEVAQISALRDTLDASPDIALSEDSAPTRWIDPDAPLARVLSLRATERGALAVLSGDNLAAATVGVMLKVLGQL
ncbi:MAG: Asd/ArgC dimerization domain-containing protein [Marinibacterium sp.]|nr:Asd/ArgC dimerization domain-containing protein [Marinibacterium sp.]